MIFFDHNIFKRHLLLPRIRRNQYFNDKLGLLFTEVSSDTSEENQLSYFQNSYFFKILRGIHESFHSRTLCTLCHDNLKCSTITRKEGGGGRNDPSQLNDPNPS